MKLPSYVAHAIFSFEEFLSSTASTVEWKLLMLSQEMLKERGVAPFSKWDKELPKIVFDPRFKVC